MENTQEKRSAIMRLYNIFYVCKAALPAINKTQILTIQGDNNVVLIRGWGECKKYMDSLKMIECFTRKIKTLYKITDWQIDQSEIRLPTANRKAFEKLFCEIKASVEVLANLCDMMEMGEAESGIDIKIPKCDSLREYMGYLKDIDFLFTQCPYLLNEKEEVKFNTVDVGSQWLSFIVLGAAGTFCILNNLAKLIQKAVEIKSNIIVCKQQEEMLKEMRQKNEVGEEIVDVFKKFKQDKLNECVSDLEGELGELKDNEERDKVKRSVENIVFLMEKGVEIYSSIETPKEIKVLFPFQKDTAILTDDILRLIEDKKESSGEE